MSEAAVAITGLVSRYIDSFNADDFETALSCYRLPFTWLFGSKAVTVSTPEEFLATMRKTKGALQRDGLSKSRLLGVSVRMLGDHSALAGIELTRVLEDGSEMQRTGGTYLVHSDGENWRLVANAAHAPDSIVPGDPA